MTLNNLIEDFANHLAFERCLSENTVKSYLRDIKGFNESSDKLSKITDLSEDTIRTYIQMKMEQGLSHRTCARILASIRSFCRFLVLENLIREDPTEEISIRFRSPRLPKVISIQWIDRLFKSTDSKTIQGVRDRAILETLYATGIRVSELANIKTNDLHLDHGFLRCFGKGEKERLVPIGKSAIRWINRYLDYSRPQYFREKHMNDYLFLNRLGYRLSRVSLWSIIKKYSILAGAPSNISPHTFRHSFATHLISRGADLRAVQEMLGHASVTTTEIYTHISKDRLKSIVDQHHPRSGR